MYSQGGVSCKAYRENKSKLVTFYNLSAKDSKVSLDDYLAYVENNERGEIMKTLKNDDYTRLELYLRRNKLACTNHVLIFPNP